MNKLAESGVASHWLYKSSEAQINDLHQKTHQWLQSLLATKTVKSLGKPKSAKPSKHGESRALRDKLDAIRSMEERMDETGEGARPQVP